MPLLLFLLVCVVIFYVCDYLRAQGDTVNFAPNLLWDNSVFPLSNLFTRGYSVTAPPVWNVESDGVHGSFATISLNGHFDDEW